MKVGLPFILAALAVLAGPAARAEDEDYVVSAKVLACKPRVLRHGGTLTLTLGPNHGAELAIRRAGTRDWYFLVVGAMDAKDLLMTPQAFKAAKQATLNEAITGVGNSGKPEKVFSRPGRYTVYNSDKLESDGGGVICTIVYRP